MARLVLTVAGAVGLTACFAQTHAPGAAVPLSMFCGQFFDALCGGLAACECGAAARSTCRVEERLLCAEFPSPALERAIADGVVRYDAEAAGALIQQIGGRGCDGFVPALGWRARDLFDFGGVFAGMRAAGEPCEELGFELISECELGACVRLAEGPRCRAFVQPGVRCDRLHQCLDLDAPLLPGAGVEALLLRCEPSSSDGEVSRCRGWLEAGEACGAGESCRTEHCVDGRCAAVALGGACLSARECGAGAYCASLSCAAGDQPLGAPCEGHAGCRSRVCVDGVCRDAGCGTF